MERQMSYELDGAFAARNAGELQTVHVAKTRIARVGGLQQLPRGNGFRNSKLTQGANFLTHKLTGKSAQPLFKSGVSRIAGPVTDSLALPIGSKPTDLADYDMGAITLPVIGTLSITQIAIGAALGMLAMKLFSKRS
jgi:hypothetical protein